MADDHKKFSDAEFKQHFEQAGLAPELFNHEAHLRLAYIHIKEYGVEKAIENICRQIAAFDQKFGDGTKFNVTITHAAVRAVHHFMQKRKPKSFADLIENCPRLKTNFKDLIFSHYSWNIFQDELARKEYLAPDLIAWS